MSEDPGSGAQCCFPVCHQANVPAHHCVVVGETCPCCPTGACCDPANGTCEVVETPGRCSVSKTLCVVDEACPENETCEPANFCPEQVCIEKGGTYMGDNTDCTDSDADRLADVQETGGSGACCGYDPSTPCDIGTDANNPDSDGDGCLDGVEIADGTDPCDGSDCCGVGLCGTGNAAMLPIILLVLVYMRLIGSRARRRRR